MTHDITVAAPARVTYRNPVGYTDGAEHTNPDPYVIRHRGMYWCYSSGLAGVNVSSSPDLVSWTSHGMALVAAGREHFWAPCVVYTQGRFWMYFSDRPAGSGDPHEEVLKVATSEHPAGPFMVRRTFFDTFSIDAQVVRDPASGEWVMFYSTNDGGSQQTNAGTSISVDVLEEMDRLRGRPRPVVLPTLDQEIYLRDRFGDGRDWYTIEGASYLAGRDTAFLLYSGNAYVGEDYFIGYSRAELGGPVADLNWRKYPDDHTYAPVIRRNTVVEGTGHNSVVRAPNLVDDWIVYHGRDATIPLDPESEQRVMRIDQLFVDGDRLTTDAPTWTPQDGPESATVADMFRGTLLGAHWTVLTGEFLTAGDAVSTGPSGICLAAHGQEFRWAVAEVWLRAAPGVGRFGLVPIVYDDRNYVAVLWDPLASTVQMVAVRDGVAVTLATAPVQDDAQYWHLLGVRRSPGLLEVRLDDVSILRVPTGGDRPARIGLLSEEIEADFAALAVTEHLELAGSDPALPNLLAGRFLAPVVIVHEFDSITADASIDLVAVELGALRIRVSLAADRYQITLEESATSTLVGEGAGATRLSVRTRVTGDDVTIRISGRNHRIAMAVAGPFTQSLRQHGALVRSFQLTTLSGHPPSESREE